MSPICTRHVEFYLKCSRNPCAWRLKINTPPGEKNIQKKHTFIRRLNFTNNKNLKIPRTALSLQHTHYALQSLTTTTTITTITNTSTANSFLLYLFLMLIISNSAFIGFMSLAKVINPIQICLGITDAPVSYEYIMLQATVNNFDACQMEIKLNVLFIHL